MVRTNRQNLLEVVSYLISFGAFFLFVAIAIRVVRRPSFKRENWLVRLMHQCVANRDSLMEDTPGGSAADKEAKKSFSAMALDLLTCVLGIQVSYLLWGLMQERIMTTIYESGERFTSSKFLVFVNRALAMCVAFVAYTIMERRGQRMSHTSPLYLFSFSSVSNIMSSVSQYEALKYVSFPTQVLSKSCKMIPVMLMGYVVSGKRYKCVEYLVALGVTAGVATFKLYEVNDAPVKNTELLGVAFIFTYMVCDSFTSNWQSKIFKQHQVNSMTMMLNVNIFSSAFTALGLVVTLEIVDVLGFISRNPSVIPHMLIMATCSALGQLFIFKTIKHYGPLVFATIQTVRQLLSVVLSILYFGHPINRMEALGIAIVFISLGTQVAYKWREQRRKRQQDDRVKAIDAARVDATGSGRDEQELPAYRVKP